MVGRIADADRQIVEGSLSDGEKNLAKPSALVLRLQPQRVLLLIAAFESDVKIFFEITQAKQKRKRHVGPKCILERAFNDLVLLRLIKIEVLTVRQYELTFRFLITPEHFTRPFEGHFPGCL